MREIRFDQVLPVSKSDTVRAGTDEINEDVYLDAADLDRVALFLFFVDFFGLGIFGGVKVSVGDVRGVGR